MKKLSSVICGIIFALCGMSGLNGEIIETQEIQVALHHIQPNSFVFFNVTGTLYEPATTLADHQWREYLAARIHLVIADANVGNMLINRIKNQIVQNIPKKNVEDCTPQLIANLQDQKIVVLGITKKQMATSYADNFGWITRNHLLSLGINFEKTLSYFKPQKEKELNQGEYSFAYGMLFTNKQPEGPAMKSFLEQEGQNPSRIVMIDNSLASLENVQEALLPMGIEFKGIRYGRADRLKEHFDPILGIIEFFAFINEGKILSDAEALEIKQNHPALNYEAMLDEYILKTVESQNAD